MGLEFTHPEWFWLLPPALAWVGWLTFRSDSSLPARRRWLAGALRGGVTVLWIGALAGARWLQPLDRLNVLFLLDHSDSVPAAQQRAALEWMQQAARSLPAQDRAGVIVFGREARLEASLQPALRLERPATVVPGDRTDLAAALRLATAAFPEHGQRRVVLLSDGHENQGDALAAAALARAQQVEVFPVPLTARHGPDVSVQRLLAPASVKQGQPFEVKAFVRADEAGPVTVRLLRNQRHLGEQVLELEAGKNLLAFPQTLTEPGFYTYEVQVETGRDTRPQNNRAFGYSEVRGEPRVLLVSSDPAADTPLAGVLGDRGARVRVIEPSAWPDSLAELQSYDALVLGNVSAGDLPAGADTQLEVAVRDFGLGLVCVGGDRAYGAGAYRGSRLNDLLPVESELSSQQVLPPGALVLVIDKSGSMAGEKMEVAKQAALAAVAALSDRDLVAVIAFDSDFSMVADLQPVAAHRATILRRISGLSADGGTTMYPPLQHARQLLNRARASLKHIIALTDGLSTPGDFEGLARALAAERITLSTVGIGDDLDGTLLNLLATLGGGRFYPAHTLDQVPQIFLQEAAVVLKTAIHEEPFQPHPVLSTEVTRGLDWAAAPPLLGHVVTEPKVRAETPLLTARGSPLLAHWQYGLGRAVAFTSDARARWAQHWLAWPGYATFWRQVLHWSLRRTFPADFATEVSVEAGEGHVSVEALDAEGNELNFLELRAAVFSPPGVRQLITLDQTGPGRYAGTFTMREPGVYLVNLQHWERGAVHAAQTLGASLNYSPELEAAGTHTSLLHRLAELTGGQVLALDQPPDTAYRLQRRRTWQPHDLWPWLLRLALVLFVLDVAVRRVELDPAEMRELGRRLARRLGWRSAAPTPASTPSLAALLARRELVRATQTAPATARAEPKQPDTDAAPVSPAASSPTPPPEAVEEPAAAATAATGPGSVTERLKAARRRARERIG